MSDTSVMAPWAKALLAALATLTAAVIGILTSFGAVKWSTTQTALVVAEAAAFWAFVTALTAHYFPQTKRQPVAVAGTITALVTASIALGIGFSWWTVTTQENAYITSLVTSVIAVVSALVARARVQPISPPPPPGGGGGGSADQVLQAAQAILDGHGTSSGDGHRKTVKAISHGHK